MIVFPEIEINEKELFNLAKEGFFKCAHNIKNDSQEEFEELFESNSIDSLNVALIKLQYTKYNREQNLLAFDCSTIFYFEVKVHIYILDEDDDTLASYILILNSDLEIVDDFLLFDRK